MSVWRFTEYIIYKLGRWSPGVSPLLSKKLQSNLVGERQETNWLEVNSMLWLKVSVENSNLLIR